MMKPTKIERQREMHGAIEFAETDIIRRVTRSEDPLRDELLWGIPNEVTLNHIATLLPWRAYEAVAKVNPDWQRAFQGRMVYDARVRSQTTQTFLVVSGTVSAVVDYVDDSGNTTVSRSSSKDTLSLFSPTEKRWNKCPPIPGCQEGRLFNFSQVILDGSVYVFGGTREGKNAGMNVLIPSAEVLVLDLAGQPLEWMRCANMLAPRCHFTIGVMHVKIFVFGGFASHTNHFEVRNQVYDPKVDAWSFRGATMPSMSVQHVYRLGQQFFKCIGWRSHPEPEEPLIDDEAELYRNAKIVLRVGDRGPELICTRDDDAEDDMDGLHEIFEKHLVDLDKPVGRRQRSPAERLTSNTRDHQGYDGRFHSSPDERSIFGFYLPDKDEWRAFEKDEWRAFKEESLGTDVDMGQPATLCNVCLLRRQDHYTWTSVRSMSL